MNREEAGGETWSSNMVLRKLLRPERYFDPPDESGLITDSSCEEEQEEEEEEEEEAKPPRKRCFICASFEHVGEQCSVGHDSCPNDGSVCLRCGDMGHDMSLCKYEYSVDDLKDVRCYVCKRFGHLCCGEKISSSSWAVSCYKCGRAGHVGLGCGRHYEEPPTCWRKKHCSSRLAEKKRRRLAKALATSAAIRERLEKKKQMKLEESNGKIEKSDGNFEEGSTSHQPIGNSEQHCTLDGKRKMDSVESEQSVTKEEESNDGSGWITEGLVFGKHEEAEFSHYTISS